MRWIKVAVATALVLGFAAIAPSPAKASVQSEFIAKLVGPAQQNERATGIPASVAIGMAALETGWGRSKMASTYTVDAGLPTEKVYQVNTLFNIKCTSTVSPYQTGCVPVRTAEYKPDGTAYYIVDNFRTYKNWGDSILDYGRLLTTASRYAKAFDYKKYPDQFVTEVRKGGYATDPKYADLVISIMKSYNLYQYNLNGAGAGFRPAWAPEATSARPPSPSAPISPPTSVARRATGCASCSCCSTPTARSWTPTASSATSRRRRSAHSSRRTASARRAR